MSSHIGPDICLIVIEEYRPGMSVMRREVVPVPRGYPDDVGVPSDNLDTCAEFCELRNHSCDSEHLMAVKPVCTAIAVDSVKSRIGKQNLKRASCGRVTLFYNSNIFFKLIEHNTAP